MAFEAITLEMVNRHVFQHLNGIFLNGIIYDIELEFFKKNKTFFVMKLSFFSQLPPTFEIYENL